MKTLVLWIDAITKDFITEESMPFLSSLIKKFGISELKPSFGFTSIGASFFTGLNPDKHNQFARYKKGDNKLTLLTRILPKSLDSYYFNLRRYLVGKDFFAPLIKKKGFELSQDKDFHNKNALNVKNLFDYLRENNIRFLYYQWPIIANNSKSWLSFNKKNDKSKVNRFLKFVKKDYDFYFLHLWDIDSYGHIYGTNDFRYKIKLIEQDYLIKKVLSKFDLDKDNIIIWSDHGMINVNKTLDLESQLPKVEGYTYFLDSTMARFWFSDEKVKKDVLDVLGSIKEGHILTENEKRKYKINFSHNEYGDEIFLVKQGVLIAPNFFQGIAKGMHGYDLTNKNELGTIIMNKKFKKKAKIVDLLPTILDTMKIKTKDKFDGRSILN